MSLATKPRARKPERLLLTVVKGALAPGDGYTAKRLRERGYKVGDILLADLRKPRQPGFHRLAHRLGMLVADNIDEFAGLDGHAVLKRLQIEANVECDEIRIIVSPSWLLGPLVKEDQTGAGVVRKLLNMVLDLVGKHVEVIQRIPRSLSFASLDEGEFREVMRKISGYIAAEYWPSLTAEQIEEMAETMVDQA